jgi:hypothetical protein
MISLPNQLEQQIIVHETTRDDAAGARSVLETSILIQTRAITDGLLAGILLRGESFGAQSWWYQFLSRQQLPSKYLPDLADGEFRSYRKDFAQRIAKNQIKTIGLSSLLELQIRILGGYCSFSDEGRINRQLAQLGSSLRLIVVGSSHYRTARMRSIFGRGANDKASLDGRFILGCIGPASVFGNTALYLFEREFAISPYMEARANGFADEGRIVVRQDVLRGEIEQEIQQLQAKKLRAATGEEAAEETNPFSVAHDMLRKALEREDGSMPSIEELLPQMTSSVLIHEAGHIIDSGARISYGTSSAAAWRQVVREDLLRFAQQPHSLDEFRAVFVDYCPESDLVQRMPPIFGFPGREDGYTIKGELEALRSDGLLFVDHDNRFYSTLYGRGERWTL